MRTTAPRSAVIALVGLWLLLVVGATSFAQAEPPSADQIAAGRVVYEANCVACHHADGAGLPGVFPPLAGNANVLDAEYVTGVILNGKTGEITINGTTYNGVMPPFTALSEEQVTSVIAFVQYGLNAQPGTTTTLVAGGEAVADGDSGSLTKTLIYAIAGLVVLAAVAIVLGPMAIARRADGGTFSTSVVWVKTAAVVLFFVVFTVMLPSMVLKWSVLSSVPSLMRDLIGSGVWFVALAAGFFLLRRAQQRRVL